MPSKTRRYWLLKSEPDCYSIHDLERDEKTFWSGVRNYQARNFMRDDMKPGDGVLFYHSGAEPPCIAGIAEVASMAYPDHTALDPDDEHFDPKQTPENPIWMMVDIKFVRKLKKPIAISQLRATKGLEKMVLLQRGSRLSVQPVTDQEWKIVSKLAG